MPAPWEAGGSLLLFFLREPYSGPDIPAGYMADPWLIILCGMERNSSLPRGMSGRRQICFNRRFPKEERSENLAQSDKKKARHSHLMQVVSQ